MATQLKGGAGAAVHLRRPSRPNCVLPAARAGHRAFACACAGRQRKGVRPLKVHAIGFDFGDREPAAQGERASGQLGVAK
jgi:hypothetical protein